MGFCMGLQLTLGESVPGADCGPEHRVVCPNPHLPRCQARVDV